MRVCLMLAWTVLALNSHLFAQSNAESVIAAQDTGSAFFNNFTCASHNNNSVSLAWKILDTKEGAYFVVERSADGDHFEILSALKVTDTTTEYGLFDNSAPSGTEYYRIRFIDQAGRSFYSKTLKVGISAAVDLMFYPNPADKFIIIRTNHTISVQVLDASGITRINKQYQAGLQVLNVSTLERGTYVLRVDDKESNRVVSQQLIKN